MKKFRRLLQVLFFVIKWHNGQKRKYNGLPYWFHLVSVARIVHEITKDETSTVVALLHDLFEDTDCSYITTDRFLNELYPKHQVSKILNGVSHLTDEYIKENYPDLNRKERKAAEANRLGKVPDWVQTIKYADLIDNTRSIVKNDKNFSVVYLKEKEVLLNEMRDGDIKLYIRAINSLEDSKQKLKENGK